ETIQSHAVLSEVSKALDLKNVWSKKYNNGVPMSDSDIEAMIKSRIELHSVRNTKFIEIKAYSDSADEAAKLANQVALSYKQYRADEYDDLKNHGINSLKEQLDQEDQKVAAAQAKVDRLRDELKISDSMANGSAPAPLITAEQFRELSSMRIQQEADYNSQATLLEKLKSMDRETLRKALPTAVSDTQLNE